MNRGTAHNNLVRARDTLARHGIRPFLVDGTLLGAIREGDFLGHDTDVDLGVWRRQWRPSLVSWMQRGGFTLHKTFGEPDRGLEYSFKRGGMKLDLFFYYRAGPVVYHAAWKDGQPIRYPYPRFRLKPLIFRGQVFDAPADPIKFLRTKYGDDWRTPVKVWDWAWGPKNAEPWK